MASSATSISTATGCQHELPERYDGQARSMLRARGERVTQPRVMVLGTLLAATDADDGHPAYSHLELSERLMSTGDAEGAAERSAQDRSGLDRVTLYRVLEWLVEMGLVHKVAGDDRVNRFGLSDVADPAGTDPAGHAHFTCAECHRVFCLDDAPHGVAARSMLPPGFAASEWTVTVRGICRGCSTQASSTQGARVG